MPRELSSQNNTNKLSPPLLTAAGRRDTMSCAYVLSSGVGVHPLLIRIKFFADRDPKSGSRALDVDRVRMGEKFTLRCDRNSLEPLVRLATLPVTARRRSPNGS